MSSVARAMHRSGASAALLLALAGCSSMQSRPASSPQTDQKLSDNERVTHVLSRLTFGARAGDAERVAAIGVNRWIEQQLHPEQIPDSALATALASIADWRVPTSEIAAFPSVPRIIT